MKSYCLAPLVIVLLFISCKKNRVCSCSISTNGTTSTRTAVAGFPPFVPASDTTVLQPFSNYNTSKTHYDKISKKGIRSNCFARREETIQRHAVNASPGIYTITTTESGKEIYECRIE